MLIVLAGFYNRYAMGGFRFYTVQAKNSIQLFQRAIFLITVSKTAIYLKLIGVLKFYLFLIIVSGYLNNEH
ncbi:hypothetical protein CKK33_02575 [Mucilaginibacter sp. MD40]|nr:hypothetical protein CKK33_02575 [Mucilaginibacter sp. MD40]